MKDFDSWNKQKKIIDSFGKRKFYHKREIWWCYLGLNIGHEQNGSEIENSRPVLIFQHINNKFCFVVPLTKSKNKNRFLIPINTHNKLISKAIISQLRPIDTKRLIDKIGRLDKDNFNKIRKAVKGFL